MLRVTVDGGGCSGFMYKFTLDTATRNDDKYAISVSYKFYNTLCVGTVSAALGLLPCIISQGEQQNFILQ